MVCMDGLMGPVNISQNYLVLTRAAPTFDDGDHRR